MSKKLLLCFSFFLCGCVTIQVPNYIKAEHPYVRKMYGDFDRIVLAARKILARSGWKIASEAHPSVFERRAEQEGQPNKDLLIFTEVKQHSMVLYSSYTHLNVFIHGITEGAEVEIRYAKVTPLGIKQLGSNRNDRLANQLLHKIEQELLLSQ